MAFPPDAFVVRRAAGPALSIAPVSKGVFRRVLMAVSAVCLRCKKACWRLRPVSVEVLFLGDSPEVLRVDAERVAAEMVDDKPIWYRTDELLVGETVGPRLAGWTDTKLPVPRGASRRSPNRTSIHAIKDVLLMEALDSIRRHQPILASVML